MVRSLKELAVFLSKLEVFEKANVRLEQYPSDSQVAAKLLWRAYLDGNVTDKHIIDLGCGTGILGIGALLLGAKHITFVDIDLSVKQTLNKNLAYLDEHYEYPGTYEFLNSGVKTFTLPAPSSLTADSDHSFQSTNSARSSQTTDSDHSTQTTDNDYVVIMNPPFGTKIKHADKHFLQTALRLSNNIYSMHKTTTNSFLEAFARDNNLTMQWSEDTSFPIKKTMPDHRKKIERIGVKLICLKK